ncbi:MAG: sulfate adenylyltransferase, partial [Paludibacteraceae bacterium]|nr:sulfate adenylyltransferase [Paludibacteraceae bacterium]
AVLNIRHSEFLPISAKLGDNVVNRSQNMEWYKGPSLLEMLETVPINQHLDTRPMRYPVQYVIRPISDRFPDYRGYAGRVASGLIRKGDPVRVLPSGLESCVTHVMQSDVELEEAYAPESVTLLLADDIDISRGDMIVRADEAQPKVGQDLLMDICWFNEQSLVPRGKYIIRQSTFETLGIVRSINYRRNINTLETESVAEIKMNDIAEVEVHTANQLVFDAYQDNRITGSVIFIDPDTNETVGAGMIKGEA